MTFVEPIPETDLTTSADEAQVEGLVGNAMALSEVDLYAAQGISDMSTWLDNLAQVKDARVNEAGEPAGRYVGRVLDDLGEAVRDGELGTHDAADALSWVESRLGLKEMMRVVAGTGGLVALFALYDRAMGHHTAATRHPPIDTTPFHLAPSGLINPAYTPPSYPFQLHVPTIGHLPGTPAPSAPGAPSPAPAATPSPAPAATPSPAPPVPPSPAQPVTSPPATTQAPPRPTRAPLHTPGGPTVPTGTPGDRMVHAAEEKVHSHRIEVPGFDAREANAVTAALSITYRDLAQVMAGVADDLHTQMDAHAKVINRTVVNQRFIERTYTEAAPVTKAEYDHLLSRVERLQGDLQRTTTELHRLEQLLPNIHGSGPHIRLKPSPSAPPSYAAELAQLRSTQATHGNELVSLAERLAPVALLAPIVTPLLKLSPQLLRKLPATVTAVDTCVVTTCPGPRNLEGELRRLLPRLLGLASLAGIGTFIEQAIQDPGRTAAATNAVADTLEAAGMDLVDLIKAL